MSLVRITISRLSYYRAKIIQVICSMICSSLFTQLLLTLGSLRLTSLCVVIFVAVAVLLKPVLHNFDAEYNGSNLITSCHCIPGLTLNIKHQLERTAVSQMYGYLQITRSSSLPMCPSIVNTPTD